MNAVVQEKWLVRRNRESGWWIARRGEKFRVFARTCEALQMVINEPTRPLVIVEVIESERGWGQRTDDVIHFLSKAAAEEWCKEFNSGNTSPVVPDWYMRAQVIGFRG